MAIDHLSLPNLYTWVKDNKSRYLECNENLAKICGLDSASQIKNKTDFHLSWKKQAEFITSVDSLVINNKKKYINSPEILDISKGSMTTKMLVTKTLLLNNSGKCIGSVGYGVDITGYTIVKNQQAINTTKKFYLGETFNNEYLTQRELEVFNHVLIGYSAKKIAKCLNLSFRTVEEYIDKLKRKLQCASKYEIISTAMKHGLTNILNENQ